MSRTLGPEKAQIFRITHRNNLAWILENGLHCPNSGTADPNFISIGNPELIDRRSTKNVPIAPFGRLSDYIPFYFTPFSPMMNNIVTGYGGITKRSREHIVIIISSLRRVQELSLPFIFTDRHAYLEAAQWYSGLQDLDTGIDWDSLRNRNF